MTKEAQVSDAALTGDKDEERLDRQAASFFFIFIFLKSH